MAQEPNLMLPGNPRYQPRSLVPMFGYDNLYRPIADVEIATLETLGDLGVIPADVMLEFDPEVKEVLRHITTSEVDRIERTVTKHDIRAWVRIAQERLGTRKIRGWVHIPLTSYDPLDTARALQFIRAHRAVARPHLHSVIRILADIVERTSGTIQIGRTHGQHALPITVGFWLATILNRIVGNARRMDTAANSLIGKISGAVGAHNAQIGLGIVRSVGASPSFEELVLAKLGLMPARISTQILPPEPLATYLFACVLQSASFGQFGRDCRHLMRSEIGEIAEARSEGQVGSSTMAHKVNPINFENLEGMWLRTKSEFGKVLDTLLSEHQRDLVGSSIARDYPIIVVNLVQQLETLLRQDAQGRTFLARLQVNEAACQRNFVHAGTLVLAEPLYIALQMAGYAGDAHALINDQIIPTCRRTGSTLTEVLEDSLLRDEELANAAERIPAEIYQLFSSPHLYIGDASHRANLVASEALRYIYEN